MADHPMREQAAAEVKRVTQAWGGPAMDEFMNDPPTRKQYAIADAVLALFPRPNPTAQLGQYAQVAGRTVCVVCWRFDGEHEDIPSIGHVGTPQPTPSAEPTCTCTHAARTHDAPSAGSFACHVLRCTCRSFVTEPPSIADMAPGTRFRDPDGWWTVHGAYSGGAWAAADEGGTRDLHTFDPSTIRDVVVPE